MCKLLIFGGTAEGRRLSEFCNKNGISAYVSVATEYGAGLLENGASTRILTGRMVCDVMSEFIRNKGISLVVDATHPFADKASENIKKACAENGTEYIRVIRESEKTAFGKYFDNIDSAVDYLSEKSGRILITTGSKDIDRFCRIRDFSRRCAVRILPVENNIRKCIETGFYPENIIVGKGPFSKEQNIRHLSRYKAEFLVTKESGKSGGFEEKRYAAEENGAELIVIRRPEEIGVDIGKAERIISERANG